MPGVRLCSLLVSADAPVMETHAAYTVAAA